MQLADDLPAPTDPRLRTLLDVDLALLDTAARLVEHWNVHAAVHGVSGVQIKVLLSLRGDDAVPMSEVATRLDYDASNLTTLVERLRARGLLERSEDPSDRRRKTLQLTPAGLTLRDAFWSSLTRGNAPMADMRHTDLKHLARLLDWGAPQHHETAGARRADGSSKMRSASPTTRAGRSSAK